MLDSQTLDNEVWSAIEGKDFDGARRLALCDEVDVDQAEREELLRSIATEEAKAEVPRLLGEGNITHASELLSRLQRRLPEDLYSSLRDQLQQAERRLLDREMFSGPDFALG